MVTLRDHTELESLTGELDRVQGFSDALRAQAHESANRLHTVISLIELGETDHALTFAVAELQTAQGLADRVLEGVGNPAVAALLLAKSAQGAERGIELTVRQGSYLPPDAAPDHELVTIVGNLVDNAFDVLATMSADEGPRRVEVSGELTHADADGVRITVTDNGPGLTAEQAASVFARGWSTKTAARPGRRPRTGTGPGRPGGGPLRRHGAGSNRAGVRGSWCGCRTGRPRLRDPRCSATGIRRVDRGHGVPMIRVLVVEDEPIAARAHKAYVERVAGFSVAAVAHSRMEAERALAAAASTWCCSTCTCPTAAAWTCSAGSGPPDRRST